MLEDGRRHVPASLRAPNSSAGLMIDGMCAATSLGVDWPGLTVDQQAVSSEHDGGLDSVALADRADEVANGGHARSA